MVAERSKALDLKSKVRCTGGSNPSHFINQKEGGAVVACLLWEQVVGGSIPPLLNELIYFR